MVIATDADGLACLPGIESGAYTVTEDVPDSYAVTSANPQTANVVEDTTCETADPVTFTNVPLTDLTVSVDSLVPGGTFSEHRVRRHDRGPGHPPGRRSLG